VSKTNPSANEAVTLTATSNVDMATSRWGLQIKDLTSGAVQNCEVGKSCSWTVSQAGGVSHNYQARIGMFNGTETQVTSNTITVGWQVAPPGSGVLLNVPFQSQWNVQAQNGGANCGPASITMALRFYGKAVTFDQAVAAIRAQFPSGDTNFKASSYVKLLQDNHLGYATANGQILNIGNLSDLTSQLDQRHPVLMEVINGYGSSTLYGNIGPSMAPVAHIIVVTGYQRDASGAVQTIFINAPLAVMWSTSENRWVGDGREGHGKNYPLSLQDFRAAAGQGVWDGVAVVQL
jgi:uncharacterized protein YvpB